MKNIYIILISVVFSQNITEILDRDFRTDETKICKRVIYFF